MRYSVPLNEDVATVCKRTFMRLFSLSSCRLQNLVEHVKRGEVVFSCNAGKNPKSQEHCRKFNEDTRNSVILHVMAFPREKSHYSRSSNQREFLSPDLNIARMFHQYKEAHPNTIVSEKYYRRVFRKYFPDLSFRRPRTDTCMTCDKYNIEKRSSSTNLAAIKQHELHLRQAEKAK